MSRFSPRTLLAPALMALTLAGCVSFGAKPPPQLLTIAPQKTIAAGVDRTSVGTPRLAIRTPDVPRALATTRVPVQINASSIAYVKDAQWAEAPRILFLRLLAETIGADGVFVADADEYPVASDRQLTGQLIAFGADARTGQAVVTFDASLNRAAPEGGEAQILRKRFTASVPIGKISAERVATPIGQAANQVAAEVSAWVRAN